MTDESHTSRLLVSGSGICTALERSRLPAHFPDVDYRRSITIEFGNRSGKPCIRGMRITASDVFEYLAGGMSIPDILSDFPELTEEDICACLAFPADRERRLTGRERMNLLFDQNLASALVYSLADRFPGSTQLEDIGLMEADDS
jgi:uncharacterized protein (DUF433 family)